MSPPSRSHGDGPCPDGDTCPDARRYGSVHPAPAQRSHHVEALIAQRGNILRWVHAAVGHEGPFEGCSDYPCDQHNYPDTFEEEGQ